MAEQSMRGAELLLQTLRQVWNSLTSSEGARHPYIVLSMLTDALKTSTEYVDVRERLERAYGAIDQTAADTVDAPEADELLQSFLTFFESNFATDLMVFSNFDQALTAVKRSSLIESETSWFSTTEQPSTVSAGPTTIDQLDAQAKKLAETCEAKEFAENQSRATSLRKRCGIWPLFHRTCRTLSCWELKAAEKRSVFLQISSAKTWPDFLRRSALSQRDKRGACTSAASVK
jgi:hypothetical protein